MVTFACRHLTCSANNRFCKLCERNPLKRCNPSSNFATKQFETQVLRAPCDAAIKVLFAGGQTSTQAAAAESGSLSVGCAEPEMDDVCLEVTACHSTLHASSVQLSTSSVTCRGSEKLPWRTHTVVAHHNLLLFATWSVQAA